MKQLAVALFAALILVGCGDDFPTSPSPINQDDTTATTANNDVAVHVDVVVNNGPVEPVVVDPIIVEVPSKPDDDEVDDS